MVERYMKGIEALERKGSDLNAMSAVLQEAPFPGV